MKTLRMASCMAPNADATCERLALYIAAHLRMRVEFVNDIPWAQREREFDHGAIQLCWLCGLPYIEKAAAPMPHVELLAAPVMVAERYGGQPVYYSDVVVLASSAFQSFDELRGTRWAYNEPKSHSGFNVVRYHLSRIGETGGYFRSAIESGAHQQSLAMILDSAVDASAIDSTVLDAELKSRPAVAERIRVIGTLGPSPMPPWVVHRDLPFTLKQQLRDVFFTMHADARGREILEQWGIAKFVRVDDASYDSIRHMANHADNVRLTV